MKTNKILLHIQQAYPHLSKKERLIADYIQKEPDAFIRCSITEIASTLNIADATVFRFCKKLGYTGFHDLKLSLAKESSHPLPQLHETITADDSFQDMIDKVFTCNIKSLHDTMTILSSTTLAHVLDIITHSDKLAFFGLGGSAVIAMDAYHKFLRTPTTCIFALDKHIQLIEASKLTDKDCAIVVSHTGMNKDTIEIVNVLLENNVRIISLTSSPYSHIAKASEAVLVSVAEETSYRSEALSSRISQLTLIDLLYVAVMFHNTEDASETLERMRRAIAPTKIKLN